MTGICAAGPWLAEEYGWTYNRMKTRSRRKQIAANEEIRMRRRKPIRSPAFLKGRGSLLRKIPLQLLRWDGDPAGDGDFSLAVRQWRAILRRKRNVTHSHHPPSRTAPQAHKAAVIFPHDCGGIPMCPSLGPADFRGSLFYQPPDYTVLGLQASVCPTACMILYWASVIFEEIHKTPLYKWSLNQDYICKERLSKPYMGGFRRRVSRYGAPCKGPRLPRSKSS